MRWPPRRCDRRRDSAHFVRARPACRSDSTARRSATPRVSLAQARSISFGGELVAAIPGPTGCRPGRLRARGRNGGCKGSRGRTAGSRSSRSTRSASTSSSAADEPAVTMTRSGATRDAEPLGVVSRDGCAQLRAARAPTCNRCRRHRGRACAAASTGAGVGKSGSPISMWTIAAAGGFERPRRGLHFHHVERRDVGDACGQGEAGLHRRG